MKKIAVICKDKKDFCRWLKDSNLLSANAIFNPGTLRLISGQNVYIAIHTLEKVRGMDVNEILETGDAIRNPDYGFILRKLKRRL